MYVTSLAATFIFVFLLGTAAQNQALDIRHNERPPSIEELLQRHKIKLTRPALVEALRNTDPEVRWLAASKLAEDKATEAVPAILEALALEKVVPTRLNIGFALAQLGELRGFSALRDICRDSTLRPYLRLQAAGYMLDFLKRDDETCRKGLVVMLQANPDADSLTAATSLLRRFADLSKEESETILQAALSALLAAQPAPRLAGSRVLGELGNRSAIPYLQSAAAKEEDEVVRSQMQADLQRLQQKQKQ